VSPSRKKTDGTSTESDLIDWEELQGLKNRRRLTSRFGSLVEEIRVTVVYEFGKLRPAWFLPNPSKEQDFESLPTIDPPGCTGWNRRAKSD